MKFTNPVTVLKTFFKILMIGMVGKEALGQPTILECPTMDFNKTHLDMGILIDKYGFRKCGDCLPIGDIKWTLNCNGISKTNDYRLVGTSVYKQLFNEDERSLQISCRYSREGEVTPITKDASLEVRMDRTTQDLYIRPRFWKEYIQPQIESHSCGNWPYENRTSSECNTILAGPKS